MDLFETIMGAMERTRILKDEALHPIKKIRYGSRRRRVGPKRLTGPFKRAVSGPNRLTAYMEKRRLAVLGEAGPEIRMPISRHVESETDRRVRELFDASDAALRADRSAEAPLEKAPPSRNEAPLQSPDAPQSPAVGGAGR